MESLDVLTIKELSEILKVKEQTIYNRLSTKRDLPKARKFGRRVLFLRKDVEEWLNHLDVINDVR